MSHLIVKEKRAKGCTEEEEKCSKCNKLESDTICFKRQVPDYGKRLEKRYGIAVEKHKNTHNLCV